MIDPLVQFLSKYVSLTEDEVVFLTENMPLIQLKKGAYLIKEGEVAKAFHFIINGSVRLFYNVGIEEKTAFFYFEDDFVSSYESYTQQVPAKHNLQCIEDTVLIEISMETAFQLLEKYPKFEFLARVAMEKELATYQDIIASFIVLSPEERYLKLLKESPVLLERIPQYYLATYIGVRPESLSRIRKRITKGDRS